MNLQEEQTKKATLKGSQCQALSRIFKPFINTLENNCSSHAFFRGMLYCDHEDNVRCELLTATENGSYRQVDLVLEPSTKDLHILVNLGKVVIQDKAQVAEKLYSCVKHLVDLPFAIDTVYFEFNERFAKGTIEDSSKPGEKVIYLFSPMGMEEYLADLGDCRTSVKQPLMANWSASDSD